MPSEVCRALLGLGHSLPPSRGGQEEQAQFLPLTQSRKPRQKERALRTLREERSHGLVEFQLGQDVAQAYFHDTDVPSTGVL